MNCFHFYSQIGLQTSSSVATASMCIVIAVGQISYFKSILLHYMSVLLFKMVL